MVEAQVEEYNVLKDEPDVLEAYMRHLSKFVKRDEVTKRMVFLTALSAYSDNPINLFLRGPSSIGKSYNVTRTLRYFPREDVWFLGGLSPTALVHDYGVPVDEDGQPWEPSEHMPNRKDYPNKEEYREAVKHWREKCKRVRYMIDLQHKILVFLEAPHIETYNKLRPILSHDVWETSFKFTDRKGKGPLRTVHVVLRGWPATIFCTTDINYIEDLATRGFTVTPEMEAEKYSAAIRLQGEMAALPMKFKEDEEFRRLKMSLEALIGRIKLEKAKVIVPYARELSKVYPSTHPRDMRDFNHFLALIKMHALLHIFQRYWIEVDGERYVMANIRDFEAILNLLPQMEETTRTGIPGHILDFYHKVVEPLETPCHIQDLTQKYNEVAERKVSSKTVYDWVEILCDVGYATKIVDPDDKRRRLIQPLKKPENSLYYSVRKSLPFFTEKDFVNWLKTLQNYSAEKSIFAYKISEPWNRVPLTDPDGENFVYVKKIFQAEYFLDIEKEEEAIKEEKEPKIFSPEESRTISRFNLNDVLGWSYLIQSVTGVCAGCGLENATLTRSVTLRDGRKLYVCEDCGREVHAWLRMKEQE